MAHIYRAFYAPMLRMNAPSGMPTKVPFLFNNILKRILKDYRPEYLGIVFDPSGPTFRDKLFEKYKAQRQPMPDEMRVQLPYVKKLCQAMRMPILEMAGFEADDVIGTLAKKAAESDVEVLVVSNDKDMMQLVGKNVRTLRTGTGGAKADVIVDEKRVEEILGVPPERVIDVMALMGDTVDNIPGAKGIGEKGATELIQRYGTVENALAHADAMCFTLGNVDAQSQRIDAHHTHDRRAGREVFTRARFLFLHDPVQRRINKRVGELLFRQGKFGTSLRQQTLPVANLFQPILITA